MKRDFLNGQRPGCSHYSINTFVDDNTDVQKTENKLRATKLINESSRNL